MLVDAVKVEELLLLLVLLLLLFRGGRRWEGRLRENSGGSGRTCLVDMVLVIFSGLNYKTLMYYNT